MKQKNLRLCVCGCGRGARKKYATDACLHRVANRKYRTQQKLARLNERLLKGAK